MDSMTLFKLAIIGCSFAYCLGQPVGTADEWTLRVFHTNDMHARFSQTSVDSNDCSQKAVKAGKCFGGFARLATLVRHARNSIVPTIFLNAGDTFKGSDLFNAHGWHIVAKMLTILNPDAMSLGNHEFDNGPAGLARFITNTTFPIVAANLDFTDEPELTGTRVQKSVVLNTIDGHQIGVIGYLTPETKIISSTGKVVFLDEVESVREEANRLRAAGIKILIALGHSGFKVDKKIAAEVDGLDLVIGAHDNTFLYNGNKPSTEDIVGPYPTEVSGVGGRKVYVVQAYAYTKYLGNLTIKFDGEGEIANIQGNPILVDNSIAEAQDVLDEIKNNWQSAVDLLNSKYVGSTKVILNGSKIMCRTGECNMGNLVVDAMIDYNVGEYGGSERWSDAAIAIQPSGTIQASITTSLKNKITEGDCRKALPFKNGLIKMDLSGRIIRQMLEHGVHNLDLSDKDPSGAFLHFSGLQVTYDLSKPGGSRVVSVLVRCATCAIPIFEPLDENKTYKVLTIDYLKNGGDGYSMLENIPSSAAGITTNEILSNYITKYSPVYPGIGGRISFVNTASNEV